MTKIIIGTAIALSSLWLWDNDYNIVGTIFFALGIVISHHGWKTFKNKTTL